MTSTCQPQSPTGRHGKARPGDTAKPDKEAMRIIIGSPREGKRSRTYRDQVLKSKETREDEESKPLVKFLQAVPKEVIQAHLGGSALHAVSMKILNCLNATFGTGGIPWKIDPAQFVGRYDSWMSYLGMLRIPVSPDCDLNDLTQVIDRYLSKPLSDEWNKGCRTENDAEHMLKKVNAVVHMRVAIAFLEREDCVSCLKKLRSRMETMRKKNIPGFGWNDIKVEVYDEAIKRDNVDVLKWLDLKPNIPRAILAASSESLACCKYMLDRAPYLANYIINRLSTDDILKLEAASGTDYTRDMDVVKMVHSGRLETALYMCETGRLEWDGVMIEIVRSALNGKRRIDDVRTAAERGCAYSDGDVPVMHYNDTAPEAEALSGYYLMSGRSPTHALWIQWMKQGCTRILEAIHQACNQLPTNNSVLSSVGRIHVRTYRWLNTKGMNMNPNIAGYLSLELIRNDNIESFEFHDERGLFDSCTDLVETAACEGGSSSPILRYLVSRGHGHDAEVLCERFKAVTEDDPLHIKGLDWMFERVPSGDDHYEGIKECMLACRNVAARSAVFRPYNNMVIIRRVAAFCDVLAARPVDEVIKMCEDLNIQIRHRTVRCCVKQIRSRFKA